MPFVSITRLRVRSWVYLPAFLWGAQRVISQVRRAEGNLAVRVLRDRLNTFWTATSWQSEPEMKQFMTSGPHGIIMRKLMIWCDEASLAHWTQQDATLPSWTEAHQRMQEEGRPSKVNYPSPAQTAFQVPLPDLAPGREVTFK